MRAALPLEIVDLILLLSLQQEVGSTRRAREAALPTEGQTSSAGAPTLLSSSSSSTSSGPSLAALRRQEQVIDGRQAVAISCLSRHHRQRFEEQLYRHVYLPDVRTVSLFARTISARSDLCSHVRSLALFCDPDDGSHRQPSGLPTVPSVEAEPPAAVMTPAADLILSACPNITHLLLSCDQFDSLSSGIYRLLRPREITLVNLSRTADLDGLVSRHRDLTAAALQDDPRIQAILGSGASSAHNETPPRNATPLTDDEGRPTPSPAALGPRAERSLSHLHLVNFDGRLLHHLATLSSLTHLVLTHPLLPDFRPGVPGLSVIPRSHLMLLLGSGNIARIVIRADLATCIRLVEELAPIEDQKLVFRPISKSGDLLFPEPNQRPRFSASLSAQASSLYDTVVANRLSLLSEFFSRVRVHANRYDSPLATDDPDTSRGSSSRIRHPRSSDSSGGGTSQSASTGWDDEGSDDDGDDGPLDFEPGIEPSDSPEPPESTHAAHPITAPAPASRGVDAPPLNIPIEELLRAERFTPAGLARTTATASLASSGSHGLTSSSSSSPHRQRQRLQRSPFALRKTDLRGALNSNLDILANLYEALASHAGLEQEMHFW